MRGASTWWLPLATLVVGVGVGWLLWGERETPPPPTNLAAAPDAGGAPRGRPEMLEAPGLAGSSAAEPLRDILHAVPAPEAERGEGVIDGTIKDAGGNAVMGVEVSLEPQPEGERFHPKERPDDPEEAMLVSLRGQMARFRWQQAYRQEATTDASGHYRFEGVTDRKHRIRPKSPGWRFAPGDYRAARDAKPGSTVDFVATPRSRVRIEVVGAEVPDRLRVSFESGKNTRGTTWRKAEPVVDVDPGTYEMTVKGGENDELRGGPVPVIVEAGGEPTVVRVELEVRPVLRLKLSFPPDEEMQVRAFIAPWSGTELPPDAVLRRGSNRHEFSFNRRPGFPGAGNVWRLTDLEPGRYAVGLARGYNQPIFHKEMIEVRAGVQDQTIEVPPLDPAEYVILAVRGPDGQLLQGAAITVGFKGEQMSSSGGTVTARRRDGRLLVSVQLNGVPPGAKGRYYVTAQVQGMGSKTMDFVPGQAHDLELRFRDPALVRVQVKGVRGSPYEGRVSIALQSTDRRHGWGSEPVDADGGVLLTGIQPGDYMLALNVTSGDHSTGTVLTVPVTVTEGKNDQTVSLPVLYEVTVRGAAGYTWIMSHERKQPFHQTQTADKDGVAVFDALPAGKYRAQSGPKSATFSVPGTSDVTLQKRER